MYFKAFQSSPGYSDDFLGWGPLASVLPQLNKGTTSLHQNGPQRTCLWSIEKFSLKKPAV